MGGLNHPILSHPNYSTLMWGWSSEGFHFFEALPPEGGVVLMDTYYFSYLLTFVCAFFLLRFYVRRAEFRISPSQLVDGLIWTVIGILLGARLGYVLFYNFDYYGENPSQIWAGSGMASHGALVGGVLTLVFYARRISTSAWHLLDYAVLAVPFGGFFIRAANFLNAELFGRPSDLPWAMRFPVFEGEGRALFVTAENQVWAMEQSSAGEVFLVPAEALSRVPLEAFSWVQAYLPQQIFSAKMGGVEAATQVVARAVSTPSHPSQLYQMLASSVLLMSVLLFFKPRVVNKPGLLFAIFLVAYGALRFLTEFFRQPDPQRSEGIFEIFSLGQILSVALILGGLLLFFALKKATTKL